MGHELQDRISLEIGRRTALRLRENPSLIEIARHNLTNWSRRNSNAASLVRCYSEWESIIAQPMETICEVLCSDTEEGRRLRQNSPFAGVLSPAEVWSIKAELRHCHAKIAA